MADVRVRVERQLGGRMAGHFCANFGCKPAIARLIDKCACYRGEASLVFVK
jgi:hypothetical protein